MAYMYFDESIRDQGEFIVGAMVLSDRNLSQIVQQSWRDMGLDPERNEYKSSTIKLGDEIGQRQRCVMSNLVQSSLVAVVVCPSPDRKNLGSYCVDLALQLIDTGKLVRGDHNLYIDENIRISREKLHTASAVGITCHTNQDSRAVAGIQLADHASHALGGMLLEELGIIRKTVKAGENSGYDPELELNLGFELWARLRYALIGNNEVIEGLTEDPDINPYFRVEGYGLLIASTCSDELRAAASKRLGINYLGCIH